MTPSMFNKHQSMQSVLCKIITDNNLLSGYTTTRSTTNCVMHSGAPFSRRNQNTECTIDHLRKYYISAQRSFITALPIPTATMAPRREKCRPTLPRGCWLESPIRDAYFNNFDFLRIFISNYTMPRLRIYWVKFLLTYTVQEYSTVLLTSPNIWCSPVWKPI